MRATGTLRAAAVVVDLALAGMSPLNPFIVIVGPTAGGKTELAIELAARLPGTGECICADSMQIYRGMDIGTAKPSAAQRSAVPHHLLDLVDPSEDGFTVDRWLALAQDAIRQIRGRGRWPIVVGGTNLYIQALLHGLFDGPEPAPELRNAIAALDDEALRQRLQAIDPPAAARIHANDRRRAIRAIEVFEQTGRRISDLQSQWSSPATVPAEVQLIGLEYSAPTINARINARVKAMFAAGLVEEVRRVQERGGLGRQASEAVGYRQVLEHLAGRLSLDETTEQIKIATRRLAKQQRTWLRRFRRYGGSAWVEADDLSPQELVNEALAALGHRQPSQAGPGPS